MYDRTPIIIISTISSAKLVVDRHLADNLSHLSSAIRPSGCVSFQKNADDGNRKQKRGYTRWCDSAINFYFPYAAIRLPNQRNMSAIIFSCPQILTAIARKKGEIFNIRYR